MSGLSRTRKARKWARSLLLICLGQFTAARWAEARDMWVTAYYAGWRQRHLPPDKIDYKAFTHLVHFSVYPRPDGTLDFDVNLLTPAHTAAAVKSAHDAGKKILFAVGGQSTRAEFESAMSDRYRAAFIKNLTAFMLEHGYDGIDVDMEDVLPGNAPAYTRFIKELRGELDKIRPRPLLTAAVLWEPALFGRLAPEFDQINIMTYALSGPYPGWVAWHSAALYHGGETFPDSATPLPSVDKLVDAFLAAGVPKTKLGIGLSFYGYVWSGGDVGRPMDAWKFTPTMKDLPYYSLAETYDIVEYDYSNPLYRWDEKAKAAYLSVDAAGSAGRTFVSYENEVAIQKKIRYVKERGLGGIIVWELGGGYRKNRENGKRDLLLQSVKQTAFESENSR